MPTVRFLVFKCCALLTSSITYNSEIISPCSHYMKKGLVYIIIVDPFGYQPSSCSKCTKLNTRALYNMQSVPFNKYAFLVYLISL